MPSTRLTVAEDLWRCPQCWAVVLGYDMTAHMDWHAGLEEGLRQIHDELSRLAARWPGSPASGAPVL